MILGHVTFGEINYAPNITSDPASFHITGAEFDQVRFDSIADQRPIDLAKRGWTGDTVLQADFEGETLDCGSLGKTTEEITHIALKRKRYDDTQWTILEKVPYDQIKNGIYVYVDRYADSAERYEYAIVPHTNDKEYSYFVKTVTTEMQTCYLYDRENRYELYYNFEFDQFAHNMPNEKIETMGRPYPVIVYNGVVNYAEGGVSCLLYTGEDGEIDMYKEKTLRKEIMKFLTNRKPKAIKSYDGTHMMIAIANTPSLSPKTSRGIYDLSFNFVEIGDMNDQHYLYNNGFIDVPTEGARGV